MVALLGMLGLRDAGLSTGLQECAARHPRPPEAHDQTPADKKRRAAAFALAKSLGDVAETATLMFRASWGSPDPEQMNSHALRRTFFAFLKAVWPPHRRLCISWSDDGGTTYGGHTILGYVDDLLLLEFGHDCMVLKFDAEGLRFLFVGGRADMGVLNQPVEIEGLVEAWDAFASEAGVQTKWAKALERVRERNGKWKDWLRQVVPDAFCGRPVRVGVLLDPADEPREAKTQAPSLSSPSSSSPSSSSSSSSPSPDAPSPKLHLPLLTSPPGPSAGAVPSASEAKTEAIAITVATRGPTTRAAARKRARVAGTGTAAGGGDGGGIDGGNGSARDGESDVPEASGGADKGKASAKRVRHGGAPDKADRAGSILYSGQHEVELHTEKGTSCAFLLKNRVLVALATAVHNVVAKSGPSCGSLPERGAWVFSAVSQRVGPLQIMLVLTIDFVLV